MKNTTGLFMKKSKKDFYKAKQTLEYLMDQFYLLFAKHRGINKKISPNDLMYKAAKAHYFTWGLAALKRVQITMDKVGKPAVNRILDLPCGHGRELRFFLTAFPEAHITACDIDPDGVDFCVKTFGVEGVYSEKDALSIPITEKFDLIWCGSLLTHLDIKDWRKFLQFFNDRLEKGGILIFTTHGHQIIDDFRKEILDLGIEENDRRRMLEEYDASEFGYSDYTGQKGIGVSLSSPEWVCEFLKQFPNLHLIEYTERGWFNYQDTVACIRT